MVYLTCKKVFGPNVRQCINISGKDGDPVLKDVIVAARRAFNDPTLNEITDWSGYVLPSTVSLSRLHENGVIHHIIVRCNTQLLDQPLDNKTSNALIVGGGLLTLGALGYWAYNKQKKEEEDIY
mmetsp:Transcript_73006/g.128636  ORF Transcript_73006/g.128636 Transcript_73006/m.128636 type:complete len:124 (-) Transcript_73006:650-1021(-)